MLLLTLKMKDFTQTFYKNNCAKYSLDPDLDPEPEPEQKLFQSRNLNRSKSLRFPQNWFFFPTPPPGRCTSWCCAAWCSFWSLPWPGGIRPSSSSTPEPGPQGNSSSSLGRLLTNPFHWIRPSSSSTPEPGPPGNSSSSLGRLLTNPFHLIRPSSSSTPEPGP